MSERTSPARYRERVSYDMHLVHAILDEGLFCHVGFAVNGEPVVLPHLYARDGDVLYLHGSTGARALHAAAPAGLRVCVTITLVDGLVLARSAFNHSVNYRSVVIHGLAEVVTNPDHKLAALDRFVEGIVPGRSDEVRRPSAKELAATTVLRVPLVEVSVKQRSGPPKDEQEDLALPFWAGVVPMRRLAAGEPDPAPDLAPNIQVPEHVRRWRRA